MKYRSFLKVLTVAVAAAGLTFVAQRNDLLVLMVAALAAATILKPPASRLRCSPA
jgi:predicted PurR-regulated permease PerM